jgi:hypothetical protein
MTSPGVAMAPMGTWRKNARGHATVNAVNPFVFADLGNGEERGNRPGQAFHPAPLQAAGRTRQPFPQNAISVAFLTSRWKAAVPVPAGGGTLFL